MTRRIGVVPWLAGAWLTALVLAALTAPWIAPDPDALDTAHAGEGPSWAHPFGTSPIGHDLLRRAIWGARLVLVIAVVATVVGLLVGGVLGVVAGYARGWADALALVVLDTWVALPGLLVLITVVTYVGRGVGIVAVAIGVLVAPLLGRVARSATIDVAGRDHVTAARMIGASPRRIVVREVLPNIAGVVGSYALVVMGLAVVLEGALSFLGFGLTVRDVTWGELMLEGQRDLERLPHLTLVPAALFLLTVLSLNLLGDELAARAGGVTTTPVRRRPVTVPTVAPTDARAGAVSPGAGLAVHDLRAWLPSPEGTVRAVDGVDLAVERGRMLAVVGESGSGKTMLARAVLGVLPPGSAASGAVDVDGVRLDAADTSAWRVVRGRRIALVFQDPLASLDPVVRVGAQIAEQARVHGVRGRRAARREAVALLTRLGVADAARRARQYPHELSGGTAQRAAIARALAGEPSVLVADEPTSALDVTVQAQLLDLLAAEQERRGLAVVLITHDLAVVAGRADAVAVMYAGRIVERGPTASVFRAPRHPYTAALLAAVPRVDVDGRRPSGIAGRPPDLVAPIAGCAFAPRCARASGRCAHEPPVLTGTAHASACHHPLAVAAG